MGIKGRHETQGESLATESTRIGGIFSVDIQSPESNDKSRGGNTEIQVLKLPNNQWRRRKINDTTGGGGHGRAPRHVCQMCRNTRETGKNDGLEAAGGARGRLHPPLGPGGEGGNQGRKDHLIGV